MAIPKKVQTYLNKNNYQYESVEHKTVFTAYDLAQTLNTPLETIAKTLLIKADRDYYLIVISAQSRLDLGRLKKSLKVKKVSIAKEADMVNKLKVKAGALTAFGKMHGLPVVLDLAFTKAKKVLFGSGSFEESIKMSISTFQKIEQPIMAKIGQKANLKLQARPMKKAKPKKKAKSESTKKVKSKKKITKKKR
ncbi:MAG: YbaK/EbsC family protein [bacterium]